MQHGEPLPHADHMFLHGNRCAMKFTHEWVNVALVRNLKWALIKVWSTLTVYAYHHDQVVRLCEWGMSCLAGMPDCLILG